MSVVFNVARHCLYLPDGSPDNTGDAPVTEVHDGDASVARNAVSDALTSKAMAVPAGTDSSQNIPSQRDPVTSESNT